MIVLAVAIVGSGPASGAPAEPIRVQTSYVADRGLLDLLDIELMKTLPMEFGGVTVNEATATMTIRAVQPAGAAQKLGPILSAVAAGRFEREGTTVGDHLYPVLKVEVEETPRSYRYWLQLIRRATAGVGAGPSDGQPTDDIEKAWLRDTGRRVRDVRIDYRAQRVRVGIVRITDSDARNTDRVFGANITIEASDEPVALARQNDLPRSLGWLGDRAGWGTLL